MSVVLLQTPFYQFDFDKITNLEAGSVFSIYITNAYMFSEAK